MASADHAYLPTTGALHYSVDDFALRIVAIDSCVPGRHHARLDAEALDWLRTTLDANREQPTLLLLHHPQFLSGIPYRDHYRLFELGPLGAVLQNDSNIKAALCGHVHRSMVRRWAGTMVAACPSTTTEIALQLGAAAQP